MEGTPLNPAGSVLKTGPAGTEGTAIASALSGFSEVASTPAVAGQNGAAGGIGVSGDSPNGVGIYGKGGTFAGQFDGKLQVNGDLQVAATTTPKALGDIHCSGTLYATTDVVLGSDCAEDFDIAPSAEIDPGTVMILGQDGALQASQNPYDTKVAGVISGAGDYRPGLILGRTESLLKRLPIALVGKVFCKVDAQYAPVEIGDMLTTSSTLGHAMRAVDPSKAFGAVIGKALQPLKSGQGLIPILVTLQ